MCGNIQLAKNTPEFLWLMAGWGPEQTTFKLKKAGAHTDFC